MNTSMVRYLLCRVLQVQTAFLALPVAVGLIYGETECWIKEPLIGVSEETISADGECELILNPNLF